MFFGLIEVTIVVLIAIQTKCEILRSLSFDILRAKKGILINFPHEVCCKLHLADFQSAAAAEESGS